MSTWFGFLAQSTSSSTKKHRRRSSTGTMEASLRSPRKSNAGSSATQNNSGGWKQQTAVLGHEALHGHRSVDDSGFFLGEEWEVLDDAGNPLSGGVDERHLSPGLEDSSARFARPVPEAHKGMKEGDRVNRKWEDAGRTHSFHVRGQTYLMDKEKRPAGPAMCRLVGVDCFAESSTEVTRIDHIASRGSCRERVEELTSGDDPPFLFIMNIQVRGTPTVSLVVYWAVERSALRGAGGSQRGAGGIKDSTARANGPDGRSVAQEAGFAEIFARYANIPLSSFGGDACSMMDSAPPRPPSDERNKRFKLIPRVISGPWVMRKAIGSTPVLLGTKIHHRYYRGEHYVETDLDTGSSTAAATLCGRCRWYSRNLDVELGIVLQANAPQELPEALLGAVRLNAFGVEDPDLQKRLFTS